MVRRKGEKQKQEEKQLTVCDIIGHFGLYQWSLTIFSAIYSSLPSLTVVIGPVLTRDLAHLCATDLAAGGSGQVLEPDFSKRPHQCFSGNSSTTSSGERCTEFVYDDANYGAILTNTVSNPLFVYLSARWSFTWYRCQSLARTSIRPSGD